MNPDRMKFLAEYVSLLYHEARNARHLPQDDYFSRTGWERILSLPKNRDEAWKEIQSTRQKARQALSVNDLICIFVRRFGVDLSELQEMFENPNWKHAKGYGGNAWAHIAKDTIQFAEAIDNGDEEEQECLLSRLKEARHNNGPIQCKLEDLDSSLL